MQLDKNQTSTNSSLTHTYQQKNQSSTHKNKIYIPKNSLNEHSDSLEYVESQSNHFQTSMVDRRHYFDYRTDLLNKGSQQSKRTVFFDDNQMIQYLAQNLKPQSEEYLNDTVINSHQHSKRIRFKAKYQYRIVFRKIVYFQSLECLFKIFLIEDCQFETAFECYSKLREAFIAHFWDRNFNDLFEIEVEITPGPHTFIIPNLESFLYLEMWESLLTGFEEDKLLQYYEKRILEVLRPPNDTNEEMESIRTRPKYPLLYYKTILKITGLMFKHIPNIFGRCGFMGLIAICKLLIHEKYMAVGSDRSLQQSSMLKSPQFLDNIQKYSSYPLSRFNSPPASNKMPKLIIYYVIGLSASLRKAILKKLRHFYTQEFTGVKCLQYSDFTVPLSDLILQNLQTVFQEQDIAIVFYNHQYTQKSLQSLLKDLEGCSKLNYIHYEVKLLVPSQESIQYFYDGDLKKQNNYGSSLDKIVLALIECVKKKIPSDIQQAEKSNSQIYSLSKLLELISGQFYNLFPFSERFTHKLPHSFIGNLDLIQIDYQKHQIEYNYEDAQEIKDNLSLLLESCNLRQTEELFKTQQNLLWYFLECIENIDIEFEEEKAVGEQQIEDIVFKSFEGPLKINEVRTQQQNL